MPWLLSYTLCAEQVTLICKAGHTAWLLLWGYLSAICHGWKVRFTPDFSLFKYKE